MSSSKGDPNSNDHSLSIMVYRSNGIASSDVTALMRHYVDHQASDGNWQIGEKTIKQDGLTIRERIVDFDPGNRRAYQTMNSDAFRKRDGFLICVDANDQNLYETTKNAIQQCQRYSSDPVPINIVIANTEPSNIKESDMQNIIEKCQEMNVSLHLSDANNPSVNAAMTDLTNKIIQKQSQQKSQQADDKKSLAKMTETKSKKRLFHFRSPSFFKKRKKHSGSESNVKKDSHDPVIKSGRK